MLKRQWKALGIGILVVLISLATIIAPAVLRSPAFAQQQDFPKKRVTSVSQITDIEPSDPYFNALENLVERYGCISVSPEGRFQPEAPLTRGQAAIFVDSCLRKFAELIETGVIIPGKPKA